jgi:DNA-binding MarR family transcriptional regulator
MQAIMLTTRFLQMPGHFIRRAQQVSSAYFAEELAESELTSVQMVALVTIADNPGIDATRLSEIIDFDRATIGGVVYRLQRKGLIQRGINAQDKRSKTMQATPAGKALLKVSLPKVERVQARLLAPLSPDERETFLRLISLVIDGAQP